MANTIIELQGLSKSFGEVYALKNISMQIPKGTIFGLLGSNGAGKSTMIRLLLGLLEPTAGSGCVMGFDIRTQAQRIRENTGVLLDNPGLYNHLTVFDNLEFYGRIWRIPKYERLNRINELIHQFNIEDKIDCVTETLSKGMLQKVAIARAIIHKPELLILDEPTTGLDPMSIVILREYLSKIAIEENKTIFISTHNLGEAEILCDMIGIIKKGELIKVERTESLCQANENTCTNIVVSNLNQKAFDILNLHQSIKLKIKDGIETIVSLNDNKKLNDILNLIISNGGIIADIVKEGEDLEDVFLRYMKEE